MPLSSRWIPFILIIVFMTGCEKTIDFRHKRLENAQLHISQIRNRTVPDDTVHTLHWCIEKALAQNLDLKAAELQQAVMNERKTAAVMGMLPDLNLNYRVGSRSNESGASSESITTGIETLEPSKSSEKDESRFHMELMFSVLDFGLSYYNSIHESDKALLEEKQMRRTAQNLMLDVAKAYFRVASIQYEMTTIKDLIDRSEKAEALIDDLRTSKRIGPLEALTKIKALKKLKQRLTEYRRSYENACIRLSSLMGFAPVNEIRVDTSILEKLNNIEVPEIEILEQVALDERPELYQLDIESHITAVEARKSMLMMFPNVRLFANFTDSSNKYLYNQSWWDVALGAVYNLLKLPSEIYNYNALNIQLEEITTQTIALSIGIMAQVRIAHANLIEVKSRYELAEELFNIDQQRLEAARPRAQTGGSLSSLDLLKYELETAETFFERTQSLSNYYLAYYRLLNAVGLESLDQRAVQRARRILPEMEAAQFVQAEPVKYQQDTAFNLMLNNVSHDISRGDMATPPRIHKNPAEEIGIKDIAAEDQAPTSALATSEKPITPTLAVPSAQSPQQTSAFTFMLDNINRDISDGAEMTSARFKQSQSKEIAEENIAPDNASKASSAVDATLPEIETDNTEQSEKHLKQTEQLPAHSDDVEPLDDNAQKKNSVVTSSDAASNFTSPAFQLMLDQIIKDM